MDCIIYIGEDVNFTIISDGDENSYVVDFVKTNLIIEDESGPENYPVIRVCEYGTSITFSRVEGKILISESS